MGPSLPPFTQPVLPDEAAFILNDLQARFLFVEDDEQLKKIQSIRMQVPFLQKVFLFTGTVNKNDPWVVSFSELTISGKTVCPECAPRIDTMANPITAEDIMCIIYINGTTGRPKGVMLTHGNYIQTIESLLQTLDDLRWLKRNLSFLPLALAFERLAGHYAVLYLGKCIAYAEGLDTLRENFKEVKSTVVTAVPRAFEKIYARIQLRLQSASLLKRKLFFWALRIGELYGEFQIQHRAAPLMLQLEHAVTDLLIYRKARRLFGGELHFFGFRRCTAQS